MHRRPAHGGKCQSGETRQKAGATRVEPQPVPNGDVGRQDRRISGRDAVAEAHRDHGHDGRKPGHLTFARFSGDSDDVVGFGDMCPMLTAQTNSVTRSSVVVMSLLRHPIHSGHLTVGALKRNRDKPVLFLGDTTLTGANWPTPDRCYIQAFRHSGAGTGVTVGLFALNRPEVLMIIGAGQTQGYRRTALHPLGSLDGHAYVLADAGVSSLIIDPNPMFVERALGLLNKVDGLRQILTIGPVPPELESVGVDLVAGPPNTRLCPSVRPICRPITSAGSPTPAGPPVNQRGRHGDRREHHRDDHDSAGRMGMAGEPTLPHVHPLSHAGRRSSCRRSSGWLHGRTAEIRPGRSAAGHRERRITATMLVPSMIYALLDHPDSRTRTCRRWRPSTTGHPR